MPARQHFDKLVAHRLVFAVDEGGRVRYFANGDIPAPTARREALLRGGSLRAEDGLFTLKIAGAQRLHKALAFPRMRVVVKADSVAFNREGKNVFAQFVEKCDPSLRPGEECLIVDWADALVACGQMHLAPSEIPFFRRGIAVHTREGVPTP